MRVLISPDSFKGSARSDEVALAMQRGILQCRPDTLCDLAPIADGGEGSLDALELAIGGNRHFKQVETAAGGSGSASYLRVGHTAYIELAQASGLPQLDVEQRKPLLTTTMGTGQLMQDALLRGSRELVLCIGGSATNDGGLGIAHALGITFLDDFGRPFLPTGGTLANISKIEMPIKPIWADTPITILCDVNNPFTGPTGAVVTFAPQKGASASDMAILERGMIHLGKLLQKQFNIDVTDMAGAGAAGGVGGGLHALLHASLVPGLSYIAERINLFKRMAEVDFVITGEGKLDRQSMAGKVVSGICGLARDSGVPVIAVCGSIELTAGEVREMGLKSAFSIQKKPQSMQDSVDNTMDQLAYCCAQIINLMSD